MKAIEGKEYALWFIRNRRKIYWFRFTVRVLTLVVIATCMLLTITDYSKADRWNGKVTSPPAKAGRLLRTRVSLRPLRYVPKALSEAPSSSGLTVPRGRPPDEVERESITPVIHAAPLPAGKLHAQTGTGCCWQEWTEWQTWYVPCSVLGDEFSCFMERWAYATYVMCQMCHPWPFCDTFWCG